MKIHSLTTRSSFLAKDRVRRSLMPLSIILLAILASVSSLTAASQQTAPAAISNPIIPGDHPDPTIIRVGSTYWTASTSGGWAPVFPLFRSTDLRHWKPSGAVFPDAPSWASGSFWAPELVYDHARVLLYYVGRKRGGPLCVAAATAPRPEGPYTDQGPLVCQPDGSIDPAMARDEHGRPFLIWKEDGNSIQQPTLIWAQPLTSDLLHLAGTKSQLLVNDPSTWEGGVVEAPYIMRRHGLFYLFYAGNGCCGVDCRYAEGVARASHLLGPWTKDPSNPIIRPNGVWKCPGHGTAVSTPSDQDYFLYHAYPASGTVFLGRESVLDRITWTPDGWPVINNGNGPSGDPSNATTHQQVTDDFTETTLDAAWQWPVDHRPQWKLEPGKLIIESTAAAPGFLARSLLAANYTASVTVAEDGGLGVIGGMRGQITLYRRGAHLELWSLAGQHRETLWQAEIGSSSPLELRVSSPSVGHAIFSYSLDHKTWIAVGPSLEVSNLLPWDQGLRIGLVSSAPPETNSTFTHFALSAGALDESPHE
jgi:xylan 1,4-beta-xylosidase